jgi:hypothetical protein
MNDTPEEPPADPVLGSSVEGAIEQVFARDPEADHGAVRPALERVAEDGIVSRAGIESALGETAKTDSRESPSRRGANASPSPSRPSRPTSTPSIPRSTGAR